MQKRRWFSENSGELGSAFFEEFGDAFSGFEKRCLDAAFHLRRHACCRSGDADGGDDGLGIIPQSGTEADASSNRFFAIRCDSGVTRLIKFGEKLSAIDDGVFGTRSEAVDLEDAIGERTILEGGDDLPHGAAVRRQDAADLVGHADFVERLDAIEDVDAVVVEIGEADGFVKGTGQALDLRASNDTEMVSGLHQPAKDEFRGELIGSVAMLLEILVLLEGEKDTEERRLGQVDTSADVFKRERRLAVKAVEDFECAADGAEIVLPVRRGGFACLESPLRDSSPYSFVRDGGPIGRFIPHVCLGVRSR